ncbi:hypothetical protein [Nitratireductor sp. OM-1]|uniref:hypothetical protein n=1 Tax=Nitratireductor sp. OM-1 TaxID=1756988 RepID=UPI0013AFD879|nr:hypothetical protein [Nitratireductor sp. OM-1]
MSYLEFWTAIAPFNLVLQDRAHCDAQIRSGEVDEDTVLTVLKHMARVELRERHGLKWRPVTPWLKVVSDH